MENTQSKIISFLDSLKDHPIYENSYFKLLETSHWTPITYALHRANFFYRTEITVKCIACVCAQAAMQNDRATLVFFSHILSEETGGGNPDHCHEVLMEQSHNLYGNTEFNLNPLLVNDSKNSEWILPETTVYRDTIFSLAEKSYACLLGVAVALEHHADVMLSAFRKAFRFNCKKIDPNSFVKNIEIYFNCHLDNGVEERHAADARQCVLNNCRTEKDFEDIVYGANKMFEVQGEVWKAMHKKTTNLLEKQVEHV